MLIIIITITEEVPGKMLVKLDNWLSEHQLRDIPLYVLLTLDEMLSSFKCCRRKVDKDS